MLRYRGLELDEFQIRAIKAVHRGRDVLVAAPTGAGKTLIAEFAIEKALERSEELIYTSPIKALSNQKYRDFSARYGDAVGIVTGDVSLVPDAQVLIMTTEILRNAIFDNPKRFERVRYVIVDEAHYLDDAERGTVWEEVLIFAPAHLRFILLSATIPNLKSFAAWIASVRSQPPIVVREDVRPVPLEIKLLRADGMACDLPNMKKIWRGGEGGGRRHQSHKRRGKPDKAEERKKRAEVQQRWHDQLALKLLKEDHLPCIVFIFSRAGCEKLAGFYAKRKFLPKKQGIELVDRFDSLCRSLEAEGKAVQRLRRMVRHGVAYHHAGMLPTLKEAIERLFDAGLIRVLLATETFALGVNMPARAVAFGSLLKFDGQKTTYLRTRDFMQMAGRAGRRGMDSRGFVYAAVHPSEDRPSQVREVVAGEVEPVCSQFNLGYSTLMSLYSRLGQRLYEACSKSFANFSSNQRDFRYGLMVEQVEARLQVLAKLDYFETADKPGQPPRLSPKGRFASRIYGYELQVAELLFGGQLDGLGTRQLGNVLTALVYQARRKPWGRPTLAPELYVLQQDVRKRLKRVYGVERACRVIEPSPPPDFGLWQAVEGWLAGDPFEDLVERTESEPGDIVRAFRMVIQLIRQILRALPQREDEDTQSAPALLRARLLDLREQLKRDEVDAEAALRRAVELLRSEQGDDEDEPQEDGGEAAAEQTPAPVAATLEAESALPVNSDPEPAVPETDLWDDVL